LVDEVPIACPSLRELRAIFGVATEDPMFDSYPVGPQNVESVQRLVSEPIDLSRFAYFVEADAIPQPSAHG